MGVSAGQHRSEAQKQTSHYRSATQQRVADCGRQPQAGRAHCIDDAISSFHEEQRAERNLDAQREAADWAWWVLIVSLCQAPITLAGVILLLRNVTQTDEALNQARAGNEIAGATAKRQLRAYVMASNFRISGVEDGRTPRVHYVIKNSGQTPAYEVRHYAQIFWSENNESVHETKIRLGKADPDRISISVIGAGETAETDWLFSTPLTIADIVAIHTGAAIMGIAGVMSYRDVFGRRHLATFKKMLTPHYLEENGCGRFMACRKGNHAN